MNVKTDTISRSRRLAALALFAALGIAASAFGAVTIYENDFKSKSEFREVRKAAGGKACDRVWYKQKAFGITIDERKTIECAYEVPVFSDGAGGDLAGKLLFKVFSAETTSKMRRGAFGFLALRASNSTRYQLRVFPKSGRWELRRTPNSGEFPVDGKLKKPVGLDKRNSIQMRVSNDSIDAWVEGEKVVSGKRDSDAAEVDGTAIRVGIGQSNKAKRRTAGSVDSIRVDVPNP